MISGFQEFNMMDDNNNNNYNYSNHLNMNSSNNIVFMPRQDNKDGRVSVKDVHKRSAACLLCRNRKRKCDGHDPCSYCVSKNWACTYTQQKKRGPQKKATTTVTTTTTTTPIGSPTGGDQLQIVSSPVSYDFEMIDKMEAQNFGQIYLKYVNTVLPMTTGEKMMNPATSAHKVQSYAGLAFSARLCGDLRKASKYISQARITAGDIYDSPNPDSVCALLMMSNYMQLVLNIPLTAHYSRLADSLRLLVPKGSIDYRVKMMCEVTSIICNQSTSNKKKAKQLRNASSAMLYEDDKQYIPLLTAFLNLSSYIIEHLNYNPILVQDIDTTQRFFSIFDTVHLDEQTRVKMCEAINRVSVACALVGEDMDIHLHTINSIFAPMYMAVVEWRSGHYQEALTFAMCVLQGLNTLEKTDSLGFACGVVDFPHVAMIGALAKLMLDLGHNNLAAQMCEKIRTICKILTPELDFVLVYVTEFVSRIPATDQPPTITLLEEENTTDINNNNNSNNNNINKNNNTDTVNINTPIHVSNNQTISNSHSTVTYANPITTHNFGLSYNPHPDPTYKLNTSPTYNSSTSSTYSNPSPPLNYPSSPSPQPNYNPIPSPNYNSIPSPNYNSTHTPTYHNKSTTSPPYNSAPSPNYNPTSMPTYNLNQDTTYTNNANNFHTGNSPDYSISQFGTQTHNKLYYQTLDNVVSLLDFNNINNITNINNNNNMTNIKNMIDSNVIHNINMNDEHVNNTTSDTTEDLWTLIS